MGCKIFRRTGDARDSGEPKIYGIEENSGFKKKPIEFCMIELQCDQKANNSICFSFTFLSKENMDESNVFN